jgi:eukaryotic-like serine/threonine-protein kinase
MTKLARLPTNGRSAEAEAGVRHVPRLRTRYYAFLSYSHRDKELADWLHRELERFRVPHSLAGKLTANGVVPRRLSPVFRDQQDLSAGGDLAEEIKAALAASQFLVVLCSPTAATSRWTNQEIESFKRTRPEGCVLAAVAAGEPFASDLPGREHEECFPPALRYKYDRRGHQTTKRAEPLAADFREDGEGRRLAFLKLVAGMLGVGLDELVQRETTRRQRRLAYLAAASIAGMAVTSTLAVTAFQARNEAREQRREAEGLVEFMLGDLRAKLEPIGKLDVLDGVGSRVLSYYRKEDASELSDAALLQRSRALNLMAEVAFLRGHLDEADGLYRQAMAGTAEAMRRAPTDTKRLFDHAQNVFYVGEIARSRGQYDQAEAQYREYSRLGERLVALEPDNLKWRMENLYGIEDVGIALYDERRFDEAAKQFTSAIGPMQNLLAIDPANQTYQKEFSTVLAWLADAQRSRGQLEAASSLRDQQVSLLERSADNGATNVAFREQLIPAHEALGILLASRGLTDKALVQLQAAVDEADRLIPVDPTNARWKQYGAAAHLELAKTLLFAGKGDEAAAQTDAGCNALAQIGSHDPAPARTRALRSDCLATLSRLAASRSDTPTAERLAQQALASTQEEQSGDRILDRYRIAGAYRLLGDVRRLRRDASASMAAWSAGLDQLPAGVAERPWETFEHATLLERLGRVPEAEPLQKHLTSIGYRSVI